MDWSKFDCIDIGADANSMEWTKLYLGIKNPIGLNIEQVRLENMRNAGMRCENMNAFDIPDDIRVDYIFMSHLLEHLQSAQEVADLIEKCIKIATKGIYIGGPVFEDDNYIRSYGLKFIWGDWRGHESRFGIYNFLPQLRHTMPGCVTVSLGFPVLDSSPDNIVALNEKQHLLSYIDEATIEKSAVIFKRPIFQEFVAFIKLDERVKAGAVHTARHGDKGMAAWPLWEQGQTEALSSLYPPPTHVEVPSFSFRIPIDGCNTSSQ